MLYFSSLELRFIIVVLIIFVSINLCRFSDNCSFKLVDIDFFNVICGCLCVDLLSNEIYKK